MIRFLYSKTSAGAVATETSDPNTDASLNPADPSSSADVKARMFYSTAQNVRVNILDGTSLVLEVWALDPETGRWWKVISQTNNTSSGSTTITTPVGVPCFVRVVTNNGTVTKYSLFQDKNAAFAS